MYQTAREKGCLKYLNMLAEFLDVMGAEYQWFDKDEVAKRLGTYFYFKALYTPDTILINPSETVRGLATVLPKNVHVFENCPVLEVLDGEVSQVKLTNGKIISCKQVIMTVNAIIRNFGVKASENLIGIHSFGAHTRELTDEEIRLARGIDDSMLYYEFILFNGEEINVEATPVSVNLKNSIKPIDETKREFLELFTELTK